jgi:nucleoside-diphosphate-sugar epimerase
VALACIERKVRRFLFASSCSVYFSLNPYDGMLTEDSEINPTAGYSLSKKNAEILLNEMASPDFCPTHLRKGTLFGASPRMRYDLVVNAFLKDAWDKGRLSVFAGGEMWRPLLDVRDACEAYINLLDLPENLIRGRAFNVLHKNYRVLELAHWIKYVLRDKKRIEVDVFYQDGVPPRSYQVSGENFRSAFGYNPGRGIAQAAMELWSQMERGQFVDFGNPQYYNITWLRMLTVMQERLAQMGQVLPRENQFFIPPEGLQKTLLENATHA